MGECRCLARPCAEARPEAVRRDLAAEAEAFDQMLERALAEAAVAAGKYEVVAPSCGKGATDLDRGRRQRPPKFLACFHAPGRYNPDRLVEVDLVPGGAADHAGARAGQDQKFECRRRRAAMLTQLLDEARHLDICHRRMVLGMFWRGEHVL